MNGVDGEEQTVYGIYERRRRYFSFFLCVRPPPKCQMHAEKKNYYETLNPRTGDHFNTKSSTWPPPPPKK